MSVAAIPSLFLHYFDPHFYDLAARSAYPHLVREEARVATMLAILAAEAVYIPAASYIESTDCQAIVDAYEPLFPDGHLRLVGGDATVVDFALAKLQQYDPDGIRWAAYEAASNGLTAVQYLPRRRSATRDIRRSWVETDTGELTADLPKLGWDLATAWHLVPDALDAQRNSAFTPEYALEQLLRGRIPAGADLIVARRAAHLINGSYFDSFARDLGAGMLTNLGYLQGAGMGSTFGQNLDYQTFRRELQKGGAWPGVTSSSPAELIALRDDERVVRALIAAVGDAPMPVQQEIWHPTGAALPVVRAIRALPAGPQHAGAYHRKVAELVGQLFPASLRAVRTEVPINEGRKRIDIWADNVASSGLFRWARSRFGGRHMIIEVKNYSRDINNPEIDQLAMRFGPVNGRFGLMICRTVADRAAVTARCRDVLDDHGALVVVLDDADLERLALAGVDPGLTVDGRLYERFCEVWN